MELGECAREQDEVLTAGRVHRVELPGALIVPIRIHLEAQGLHHQMLRVRMPAESFYGDIVRSGVDHPVGCVCHVDDMYPALYVGSTGRAYDSTHHKCHLAGEAL